jgi:hypothetical protein
MARESNMSGNAVLKHRKSRIGARQREQRSPAWPRRALRETKTRRDAAKDEERLPEQARARNRLALIDVHQSVANEREVRLFMVLVNRFAGGIAGIFSTGTVRECPDCKDIFAELGDSMVAGAASGATAGRCGDAKAGFAVGRIASTVASRRRYALIFQRVGLTPTTCSTLTRGPDEGMCAICACPHRAAT